MIKLVDLIKENSDTYSYKLDPKTKKYDVIKLKNGAKITSFDTEERAKKHTEKINRLSKGYADLAGKIRVHEDDEKPSSKLSSMSLGMKTSRVVISGEDVPKIWQKIDALGKELDPNWDMKYFDKTGKMVGVMSTVKIQPLNLKFRDRSLKAHAEDKPVLKK
jgi:hypothetical protein